MSDWTDAQLEIAERFYERPGDRIMVDESGKRPVYFWDGGYRIDGRTIRSLIRYGLLYINRSGPGPCYEVEPVRPLDALFWRVDGARSVQEEGEP